MSSRYGDYFRNTEHRAHSVLPLLADAVGAVQRIIDKVRIVPDVVAKLVMDASPVLRGLDAPTRRSVTALMWRCSAGTT